MHSMSVCMCVCMYIFYGIIFANHTPKDSVSPVCRIVKVGKVRSATNAVSCLLLNDKMLRNEEEEKL